MTQMSCMIRAAGRLLRRSVAASLLLGWGGLSVAATEELTIVAAHKIMSLPLYVAESQGYFATEGVQVKLMEETSGPRALQQLYDGKADLVTAADTVVMFESFKRNDFAVIANLATSNKVVSLIAGRAQGSARPEQLSGKRVGTVSGTASDYFVDTWLVFHGVDPKSTRRVSLQPDVMASGLANGAVDAVAIWDPFAYEILKTVQGARLLPDPGIYALNFNLIVDRKRLGARDHELSGVLRALLRAEQFILAEPGKAQAILRKYLKQDQGYIDAIWPHFQFRIALTQSLVTTLESQARWARLEGHVIADRSPNYLGFIHAEPLRKVRPDRISIGR